MWANVSCFNSCPASSLPKISLESSFWRDAIKFLDIKKPLLKKTQTFSIWETNAFRQEKHTWLYQQRVERVPSKRPIRNADVRTINPKRASATLRWRCLIRWNLWGLDPLSSGGCKSSFLLRYKNELVKNTCNFKFGSTFRVRLSEVRLQQDRNCWQWPHRPNFPLSSRLTFRLRSILCYRWLHFRAVLPILEQKNIINKTIHRWSGGLAYWLDSLRNVFARRGQRLLWASTFQMLCLWISIRPNIPRCSCTGASLRFPISKGCLLCRLILLLNL